MPNIALLAVDNCLLSSLSGPQDIFAIASSEWLGRYLGSIPTRFNTSVVAAPGRKIRTFTGNNVSLDTRFSSGIIYDIIFIPVIFGSLDEHLADLETIDWLVEQAQGGACLCSVCAGAFLLARTGLLQGRKATTHWQLADEFANRFPGVLLQMDKLLIDEGNCITAGGISAYMDLSLYLTARFGSPELAASLSRLLLIDSPRRLQTPYRTWFFPKNHGDTAILDIQQWLEEHFRQPLSVHLLAKRARLGERTFMRKFKKATGETPLAYIQQLRMEEAKKLLQTSRKSIEEVTQETGYEDVSSFRKLFLNHTGLSPSAYRQKFSQFI